MAGLRGELYGVKINGDFIPCEIDAEITITSELVGKSGSQHGKYRRYRYGYISWSISCNARAVVGLLNSSSQNLITSQLDQIELEVYISARQSNIRTFDIGGMVLIETQQLAFPNTGYANHSISMKGNGELNLTAEEIDLIINAMPADADKPLIIDTTKW